MSKVKVFFLYLHYSQIHTGIMNEVLKNIIILIMNILKIEKIMSKDMISYSKNLKYI